MQKLRLLILILFCFPSMIEAQTYFNEWIDYDQTYYKFQVEENGVYRIPYSVLLQAGLTDKAADGFHLYSKGKEVPIYASTNNLFAENDYIEFYGEQNDGSFDSQLFMISDHQLTNERSLFSDAATYYLVWNDAFEGMRFEELVNDLTESLPEKEPYFMHREALFHREVFNRGEPERIAGHEYNFPDFGKGEGWTGTWMEGETSKVYELSTLALSTSEDAPTANLETKVVGLNNDFFNFKDHHLRIYVGETVYIDNIYEGYNTPKYETKISLTDLNPLRTAIRYESVGDIFSEPSMDYQSVSYTFLTYPRQFDFGIEVDEEVLPSKTFAFSLQNQGEAYFEVSNFEGGTEAILYDLSHQKRILVNRSEEDLYKIHLEEQASMEENRALFLVGENGVNFVEGMESLQFTDFQAANNQGDYLLVYHPLLTEGETNWVSEYADYRSSVVGGRYNVVMVNIEELYDQFAHGIEKHPLSIRHFVNFAIAKWTNQPELLFLMGKSISYNYALETESVTNNLVPTFGHTPSDNYLTLPNRFDYRPQLGIGRLSAKIPEEVRDYLQKVQAYEDLGEASRENRLWRKHAFFQVAGSNQNISQGYEELVNEYSAIFETPLIGGKVLDIQIGRLSEDFNSRPFIEEGLGLLGFWGNNAENYWDVGIEYNPNDYTQKEGRYPFAISGGEFIGSLHNPLLGNSPSLVENWVLAPNSGSIAFLSIKSFGFLSTLDIYTTELMNQFQTDSYGLTLGEANQKTIENIYIGSPTVPYYESVKAMSGEFALQGDPAVRLAASFDRPEYIIENGYDFRYIDKGNEYEIKTENRNDVLLFDAANEGTINLVEGIYGVKDVEELQLQIRVGNLGKAIEETFEIEVRSQNIDGSNSVLLKSETFNAPFYESIYEMKINLGEIESDIYQLVVGVDAANEYAEDSEDNNEVILNLSTELATDITSIVNPLKIEVYPNPFMSELQIEGNLSSNALWQLFDTQGKMLFEERIHKIGSLTIPKNLAKGLYVLKITDGKDVWTKKVVKE